MQSATPSLGSLAMFAAQNLPSLALLAAEFDRASDLVRDLSALTAREAALWGDQGKLELRDDKLEHAELLGIEADRYAAAAAMIRRFESPRHPRPSLAILGDPDAEECDVDRDLP